MRKLEMHNGKVTDGGIDKPDVCPNCESEYDIVSIPGDDISHTDVADNSKMCFIGTQDAEYPGWQFYHNVDGS
jgi:hypothetical protein